MGNSTNFDNEFSENDFVRNKIPNSMIRTIPNKAPKSASNCDVISLILFGIPSSSGSNSGGGEYYYTI